MPRALQYEADAAAGQHAGPVKCRGIEHAVNVQADHFVHRQVGDVIQVLVDQVGLPGGSARHHGQVVARPGIVEIRRRHLERPASSFDGMPAFEVWSPVGWAIAGFVNGTSTAAANNIHMYTWWIHAVMVMFFIAYIPYSKAMHMLIDYANLMFIDEMSAKRLPGVSEEQQDKNMGYEEISEKITELQNNQ